DVGEVVAGVGVARVLLERALRQPARLLEAVHLVVGEGQRRLKPPVVAVGGGQALEEDGTLLLAVAAAREADGAARLVDQEGVAREQPVHAVLEARGGDGRRGRDGQSVAVGDGHGRPSILTARSTRRTRRRPRCPTSRSAPRVSSPPTSGRRRSARWSYSTSTSRASRNTTTR